MSHFPADISLTRNPLVEAWLEIQWSAKPKSPQVSVAQHGQAAGSEVDPFYQLAVGAIYRQIKDDYPTTEYLPANDAPPTQLPHAVRIRFRRAADQWPVMQFGPGIGTVNVAKVNFARQYSWSSFRGESLRLREVLLNAYEDAVLEPIACSLRYRNAIHFNYADQNILEFLKEQLNLDLRLSPYIPGDVGAHTWPTDINLNLRFLLVKPEGAGVIRVQTGFELSEADAELAGGKPIILLDYEVQSRSSQAPALEHEQDFGAWLEDAHDVLHDWFFASIEGPLRESYGRE